MAFTPSAELAAEQIAATLSLLADQGGGSGNAAIHLFTTTRPATPNDPAGGTPQVVIELTNPPGTITNGVLTLTPKNPTGDSVAATGAPKWGRIYAADGTPVADGTVTDNTHGGDIQVIGGTTAPGATSPTLVAGGLVLLGTVALY